MRIGPIGASLVLLAAASVVEAQTADTTLDEVTVTATRIEEPQSEVPSSVTVIPGSQIEERGAATVAQAVETAAGVLISDYGPAVPRRRQLSGDPPRVRSWCWSTGCG